MSVIDIVPFAASAAGALGLSARMCVWRRRPVSPRPNPVRDIVNEAPAVLRGAVLHVAITGYTRRMFTDLGLGSPKTGFPIVEAWDYDRHGLVVDVLMHGNQSLSTWSNDKTCEAMAHYMGVSKVVASSPAPGCVRLSLRVHDTLAEPVLRSTAPFEELDLTAVPVGVREDGDLWRLQILYRRILIAGASDSGKGSVLWSIILGLGPAIRAGLVDVWMADPKGGMEFGRGEDRLWVRFEWTADGILAMLTEAEHAMQERAARLKAAKVRKFVPTPDEPLNVLIIDEYAAMSAFATPEQMKEGMRLLGLLLTQGRAVGWSVIVAVQDPSKETVPNRQLFTTRVGLRLDEPTQVAMIHGQGARDRGARCDEIPESTQGVAYVGEDGTTEFARVRAFWIDDDQADAIVDTYSPAPEIAGPTEDYSGFDPDDLGEEHPDERGGLAA
ncbi:FtsK/SpoIIIE domain-containing protein [Nocardia sp. NPDC003482]